MHDDDTGILNFNIQESSISVFFGKEEEGTNDLLENLDTYEDRTPLGLLPILSDGMGNFVGIQLDKLSYCKC